MPEALKERSEIPEQYKWDLTRMYADDAAWEKALDAFDAQLQALAAYAGKLNTAAGLRAWFDAQTRAERTLSDLFCYASLRRSEDTRAEAAQVMYARAMAKYVQYGETAAFAEPEILALPEETLKAFLEDSRLAPYRFLMENLLRRKPHTLSAAEEQLLASFGEVISAPGEISDNLQDADLVFDPVTDSQGGQVEVTGSNYILLQSSTDRTLRQNAFRSYYKGYRQHINTFAATYSANVKAAAAEARARHYESSRAMSMAGENIPASVYDNLVATVRKHLPAMYRYVALRKKILGVDELHYYDVYAPLMPDSEARYTYEQAQQMVLDAVAPLGEDYVEQVKKAFATRWIDVYPNRGKSGGAYSSGSYDSDPYILTNFTGTLDSVSTIAHEMGHSMHTWHSNHAQPPQYANYTLFVAEVASTTNEILVLRALMERYKDDKQAQAFLTWHLLDGFRGTVFRQTMFAEFEREAHAMAERGEALTAESLNAVYAKLNAAYYPQVRQDALIAYEWMRIPHFYNAFYVYKYATGFSAAMALAEGIRTEGAAAVERYKKFLSLGSSVPPLEALRVAGVDMEKPEAVDRALDAFDALVEKYEELTK